jgi:hypothetical protein
MKNPERLWEKLTGAEFVPAVLRCGASIFSPNVNGGAANNRLAIVNREMRTLLRR